MAELIDIDDPRWGGALASLPHDVYHTTGYVEAEAIRLEARPVAFIHDDGDRVFFLPLLLRAGRFLPSAVRDADGTTDAVSPYGYPGPLVSPGGLADQLFVDGCVDALTNILAERGVCSAFIRLHPLLNETLPRALQRHPPMPNGATVSIDLDRTDQQLWAGMSRGHANAVNKARRFGYEVLIGPLLDRFDDFCVVYKDSMARLGASAHYDHGREHLAMVAALPAARLAVAMHGEAVAGAYLFFEHAGIIQMHLGGPLTEFLRPSPSHLLIHAICRWAKSRNNHVVHLGGGVGAATTDSLFEFKWGFSHRRHPYYTLRLVVDPARYSALVRQRASALGVEPRKLEETEFFPAYRAPVAEA